MTDVLDLVPRFLKAAKNRKAGWFRFFVPLDGTAIALEMKIEASFQVSRFRVSDQQTATLEEKPRLRAMLVEAANNRLAMVNLLLEEFDMPWEVLRSFRHRDGATGAIIEAADARFVEIFRERRDADDDCA